MPVVRSAAKNVFVFPILFGCVMALYLLTLAPGVIWGDSAKLTVYALENDPHWSLFPGAHPLHVVVAKILSTAFAFFDYAVRINAVSAVFGALTVVMCAYLVEVKTKNRWAAIFTAISLAVSHTVWHLSVIAESYTLAAFLLALSLVFLVLADEHNKSWLRVASGFVIVTATLANAFPVLAAPGVLICAAHSTKLRGALEFVAGTLIGGAFTVALLLTMGWSMGTVVNEATTYIAANSLLREIVSTAAYSGYQFFGPMLIAILASLLIARKDRFVFGVWFGIICLSLFCAAYMYQRKFNILIGAYVLLAINGGIFFGRIKNFTGAQKIAITVLQIVFPVALYLAAPTLYNAQNVIKIEARPVPGRDISFFLQPWKNNKIQCEEWARGFLRNAPPNSVIYADFTLSRPLVYIQKNEKLREDVIIFETDRYLSPPNSEMFQQSLREKARDRTVVLAQDYEPYYFVSDVKKNFEVTDCGGHICVANRR
jgi:hypothetical protein